MYNVMTMRFKNNPLNIRYNQYLQGVVGNDGGFCEFASIDFCISACFVILNTYKRKYNRFTVADIVTRWAPPTENNTSSYITFVCDKMNVHRGYPIYLGFPVSLFHFVSALCLYETGYVLSSAVFDSSYDLYLRSHYCVFEGKIENENEKC